MDVFCDGNAALGLCNPVKNLCCKFDRLKSGDAVGELAALQGFLC